MKQFILPMNARREAVIRSIIGYLRMLPMDSLQIVKVEKYRRTRSNQQNAYLWGAVYPLILAEESLDGWTAEDLHDFFLGEHFGWNEFAGMGRTKVKPVKRSSKLTTTEFNEHIEFIQRYMANRGVYIPDPNEDAA